MQKREQFIRDGYVVMHGVIHPGDAASTRSAVLEALKIREDDPAA